MGMLLPMAKWRRSQSKQGCCSLSSSYNHNKRYSRSRRDICPIFCRRDSRLLNSVLHGLFQSVCPPHSLLPTRWLHLNNSSQPIAPGPQISDRHNNHNNPSNPNSPNKQGSNNNLLLFRHSKQGFSPNLVSNPNKTLSSLSKQDSQLNRFCLRANFFLNRLALHSKCCLTITLVRRNQNSIP